MPDRVTYTVEETAVLLGISETLTRCLIREGRIPALRLGKRIVVLRSALSAWLEQQSAGGAA